MLLQSERAEVQTQSLGLLNCLHPLNKGFYKSPKFLKYCSYYLNFSIKCKHKLCNQRKDGPYSREVIQD